MRDEKVQPLHRLRVRISASWVLSRRCTSLCKQVPGTSNKALDFNSSQLLLPCTPLSQECVRQRKMRDEEERRTKALEQELYKMRTAMRRKQL